MSSSPRRGFRNLVIFFFILAVAIGNVVACTHILPFSGSYSMQEIYRNAHSAYEMTPVSFAYIVLSPIVAGLISLLLVDSRRKAAGTAGDLAVAQTAPPTPAAAAALRLLSILQQEGRFIDFLEEDIDPYSDEQVGGAVRSIHSGCRKALHDRMHFEHIYAAEDGAAIEIAAGFDPATVRLTGNVHGKPPFRGTIQHGGWRVTGVTLPAGGSGDPAVLAPAEVEIS